MKGSVGDAFVYSKRATLGGIFVEEVSPTKCLAKRAALMTLVLNTRLKSGAF